MPDSPRPKTIQELIRNDTIRFGNNENFRIRRLATGIVQLDNLLGGGVPLGRCILNYGPESAGKTLIAQYVTKAVQNSAFPDVLYIDQEKTYDEPWWAQSGVDTSRLMVADPTTAEQAINIMRGVLTSCPTLGMIIVDSIAAMIPQQETDEKRGSEEPRQPGLQAKAVTFMYHQIVPLLKDRDVIMWSCNQMREGIGTMDELASLPGGRAQRHYSHIILKTRRESWINNPTDATQRIGYYMDITNKKNKTSNVADGANIRLPIMFGSQLDWTTSYIEDGIRTGYIVRRGPYYEFNTQRFMGMQNLRTFFGEYPEQLEALRVAVDAA